jgi:hypothetical protein
MSAEARDTGRGPVSSLKAGILVGGGGTRDSGKAPRRIWDV